MELQRGKRHFCQMQLRDQESIGLDNMGILGDLDKSSFNAMMKRQAQIKLGQRVNMRWETGYKAGEDLW